jgi:hypothetical protein
VELDTLSQPELEQIARLGGADLVIGLVDTEHAEDAAAAFAKAREALTGLPKITRAVLVCCNGAQRPGVATPAEVNGAEQSPALYLYSLPAPSAAETTPQSISHAFRTVLAFGEKLDARACGVVTSQPSIVTPQWIYRLVHPILELGFDLAAPRYIRHKMQGLLNRSVLSPLYRALYGEQLQNPMGPDFGLSGNLLRRVLGRDFNSRSGNEGDLLASIASTAACGGFQLCESYLGARTQPPIDWMNLSSLLAQVLGPVFLEMERQAASWQRIRGSKTVLRFGSPEIQASDTGAVDVRQMIESFQLGVQSLNDVWGVVLAPTTLLELRKLSRLPPNEFRLPDDLWVRTVYDFALGHRQRSISRDHLIRSLTPLYLGWIASYTLELENATPAEIEARIERLSSAYETHKPYLVSRWRWPDHFNP